MACRRTYLARRRAAVPRQRKCAASERELLPVAAAGVFSGIFGERLGKKNLQISSKIMSERRVYSCERCGVRDRAGSYQAWVNYAS